MKGKKNQQKASDLSNQLSENTQFLGFLREDFFPHIPVKDPKSKIVLDHKEFLTHVCAQFKSLLELPHINFWSTVSHNAYLARSLDSFLAFARRKHYGLLEVPIRDEDRRGEEIDTNLTQYKGHIEDLYNELYRAILCIYERLATDPFAQESFDISYEEVIYQNWLFDIPKFLDICAIYEHEEPSKIQNIIQKVFNLEKAYHDDFKDFIYELTEGLIPNNLKILNRHRKREDIDASTLNADTEEKEKVLIILYDILQHLEYITIYFPKTCLKDMYADKKFLLVIENLYVVVNSCSKTWRVLEDKRAVLLNLVKRIDYLALRVVERVLNNAFSELFQTSTADKALKNKALWTQLNGFLSTTGKTALKKKDEEPNHKFLRKLLRYVDLGSILQKAPENAIKEDDIQTYQVVIMLLKEKTQTLLSRRPQRDGEDIDNRQPDLKKEGSAYKKEDMVDLEQADLVPKALEIIRRRSSMKEPIDKEAASTREAIQIIEMSRGKK